MGLQQMDPHDPHVYGSSEQLTILTLLLSDERALGFPGVLQTCRVYAQLAVVMKDLLGCRM